MPLIGLAILDLDGIDAMSRGFVENDIRAVAGRQDILAQIPAVDRLPDRRRRAGGF